MHGYKVKILLPVGLFNPTVININRIASPELGVDFFEVIVIVFLVSCPVLPAKINGLDYFQKKS